MNATTTCHQIPVISSEFTPSLSRENLQIFGLKIKVYSRSQDSLVHVQDASQSEVKSFASSITRNNKCEKLETLLNEQTAKCQCLQEEQEVHQIKV